MRGSEVRFYADLADMGEVLEAFENSGAFVYTATLSEVGTPLTSFSDPKNLMRFLRTDHPQPSNMFVITPEGTDVHTQSIKMRDGSGMKTKADQLLNPDAVLIKLGGQLREVLVATSINTTADTSKAKQTFKLLKGHVVANARHMGGFYVLPGALKKLENGWRLTPDPGFSRTEDLKLGKL